MQADWTIDRSSGLALPFHKGCQRCGSDRLWRDLNGNLRCFTCVPPNIVIQKIQEEKKKRAAEELRQVDDFIAEDEDIQDFNFRHFGQRTS